MRTLGIQTFRELAAEVGITEKTVSEVVKRPALPRDPSIILWLSRVLLVGRHELEALRAGADALPPDDHRVAWPHYEANRRPAANYPGVPADVAARFRTLVADDPEAGLARAIQLYVAAHEAVGRHRR
jgi:hypothetical protein